MYMAGSYGSLVHIPTELVRLIRGRPALFPGHASEMYRAGQKKRLPVTMASPTQFNFWLRTYLRLMLTFRF